MPHTLVINDLCALLARNLITINFMYLSLFSLRIPLWAGYNQLMGLNYDTAQEQILADRILSNPLAMGDVACMDPRVLQARAYLAHIGHIDNDMGYEAETTGFADTKEEREEEKDKEELAEMAADAAFEGGGESMIEQLVDEWTSVGDYSVHETIARDEFGAPSYKDVQVVNSDGSLGAGECRRLDAPSFASDLSRRQAEAAATPQAPAEKSFFSKLKDLFSDEATPAPAQAAVVTSDVDMKAVVAQDPVQEQVQKYAAPEPIYA